MINQVIQLTKPKTFEIVTQHVELLETNVIVRPTYLSICHADQRYYKGMRSEKVLNKKLPMALIHEAIGEVQYDPLNQLKYGERVVLIPNISGSFFGFPPSLSEKNEKIGENYCLNGKFRSSGFDGFMQEIVSLPRELIIRTPEFIPAEILAITELVSVCVHSLKRFSYYSHGVNDTFGVWGDGNISYILSLLIKREYPKSKVIVFGKHVDKLEMFSFVDETYLLNDKTDGLIIHHFFECVGGEAQTDVLNRMIDLIYPGGTISTLGVSETAVPLNVRLMMEKGIVLVNNSRSGVKDFQKAIDFMQEVNIVSYLSSLINNVIKVESIKNIHQAFEMDSLKHYGKTVMEWRV